MLQSRSAKAGTALLRAMLLREQLLPQQQPALVKFSAFLLFLFFFLFLLFWLQLAGLELLSLKKAGLSSLRS